MNERFIDLIQAFKQQEGDTAEAILPALDDALLRNGLLAWQSMIIDYNAEALCPENDAKRQWEWLWKQIKFDIRQYATIVGIKEYDVAALIMRLRAFHLIYPDGTANTMARAYLRKIITSKVPNDKKKKEKENAE
jgi:hypothetical protein